MVIVARLVAILLGLVGIAFLIKPDWMKKVMAFWKEGNRFYIGGTIRIVIGILLLAASPDARVPLTSVLLGLLALVSGGLLFVMGAEEVKKMIGWFEAQSAMVLRLTAAIVILFGALILSAV